MRGIVEIAGGQYTHNEGHFVDSHLGFVGKPHFYELSVEDARGVLSDAQSRNVEKVPADIEDRLVPVGPKGQVAIRIVRPKGSAGELPAVMYFHGGGH
jgi:acetyl esterase